MGMEFFDTIMDIFLFVALLCGFYFFLVLELIGYIKNSWHGLKDRRNRWKKRWKHRWGNSWWGRNFDFTALVIVLFIFGLVGFVLVDTFLELVGDDDKPNETKAYKTIWHYVFQNPLVLAALIGFPILIRRVSETRLQSRTMQYNAANELLWSKDKGSRMAGIEALWRFANTYPKEEYHNVMDVFTQFIKYPIPYEWEAGTKKQDKKAGKRDDIRKILRYMGKKIMAGAKPYEIDLSEAHLEGADLRYAHLEGADLSIAHLEGADLRNAYLEGACLMGVYLRRSDLWGAHLEGADLWGAHLEGAVLRGTNLRVAHLEGADLRGAILDRTDLRGADLMGSDFRKSEIWGIHLTLALINGTNFTNTCFLIQQQIDECFFIKSLDPPILPTGITPPHIEMTYNEWEEARKKFGNPP